MCGLYAYTLNRRRDVTQRNLDHKADKTPMDELSTDVMATQKMVKGEDADIATLSNMIALMH